VHYFLALGVCKFNFQAQKFLDEVLEAGPRLRAAVPALRVEKIVPVVSECVYRVARSTRPTYCRSAGDFIDRKSLSAGYFYSLCKLTNFIAL
jgi:hypothetical protein